MWDKDEESRRMCELSLPAIHEKLKKLIDFIMKDLRERTKNIPRKISMMLC